MHSVILVLAIILAGCSCPGGKEYRSLEGERVDALKSAISKMSEKELDELVQELNCAKEFVPNQVIVRFKEGTAVSKVQETISTLGAFKSYQFKSSQALLLSVPGAISRADVLAMVAALNEVESVDYAAPNGILKVSTLPNDPEFVKQTDLINIQAQKAWNITQGSHDVLVGIIDTGVDYLHSDLVDNIWNNPGETGTDIEGNDKQTNGIDDDGNGYVDDLHGYDFVNNLSSPMDEYGHGTHVAGTIGASGNNGLGITGINWRVKMVALKTFGADGSGTDADIVKAVEYATQMNIPITNNSYGGAGYNQALKDAIEANSKKGFLFIAAAGNNSFDNDIVDFFPANYGVPNIISVAAVDDQGNKPSFSNWGSRKVDITAPGVDILSLAVSGSEEPYVRMSGTSMAAPHVTGAAALIKAAYPDSDFLEIKTRIIYGADQLTTLLLPNFPYSGFRHDEYPIDKPLVRGGRRLNLEKSLEQDVISPGSVGGVQISFSGLTSLEVRFQEAGDDGSSGAASGYLAAVSSGPLTNEEAWAASKPIDLSYFQVNSSGMMDAVVPDLAFLQKGYLTLRSVDNAGNIGPLNPSLAFELAQPKELFVNDGESNEGIISKDLFSWTVPFLQEDVPGRGKVWSDTPPGERIFREYTYMEFDQDIEVPHSDVVLQFESKLDCIAVWERALIQIRINNETDPGQTYYVWNPSRGAYDWFNAPKWRYVGVYSAPKCEWATVRIPLDRKVKAGDKVRLRFFYRGGGWIDDGHDGWMIDDIKLLAPGSPEKPTDFVAQQETETSPYVLKWNDNSKGETHFEISGRSFNIKTETNISRFETGQTSIESDLKVRACNGTICSEWSDAVRIMAPPPRLMSISPSGGPLSGGNTLTFNGAGFSPDAIVRIQGEICPNTVRVSANQITCTPLARTAGVYNVGVINPDSQKAVLLSAYTYRQAPTVSSATPLFGKPQGGETLTINGSGFYEGASIKLGNRLCANTRVLSHTQIVCSVPPNAEGFYPIIVVNSDNQTNSNPNTLFRVALPRWVATDGGNCSDVCSRVGLNSRLSPEGSYCTSGEQIPRSAVGKVPYPHGCWPFRNCRSQGTRAAIQVGRFCYGASQKRDSSKSDITTGCYCGY